MNVMLEKLPEFNVAYIRNIGPYPTIANAFEKLGKWVEKNGGGVCTPQTLWLAAYWDCPKTTPPEKCRADACITVPEGFKADDTVQVQKFDPGFFATYLVGIKHEDGWNGFPKRWAEAMEWLAKSGHKQVCRPCYEIYYNCAFTCPVKKWVVDICVPIEE